MSEKLNHSDISALLAKEAGLSVAKADFFTKALFDIIIEGLEQDGIVKINGLGTFKVTDVADRSSVNVNTGEKIEIKGHRKLTFVPAESLKECVNRPFAMFEPVEIDDNYQDESDDEANGSDAVSEESSENMPAPFNAAEVEEEMPLEDECNGHDEVKAAIPIEEEQVREEDDNVVSNVADPIASEEKLQIEVEEEEEDTAAVEPTLDETTDEVAMGDYSDDVTEETRDEEPVNEERAGSDNIKENSQTSENTDTAQPDDAIENDAAPVKKRNNIWRFAIYFIIGAVCGFVAIKMMDRNHASDETNEEIAVNIVSSQEVIAETKNEPAVIIEDSVASATTAEPITPIEEIQASDEADADAAYSFILVDELAARNDRDITDADTTLYVTEGDITVHVVAADERLAKIAYDYYGSRKLWPYIAKHNNLKKPYGIAVGMELSIPKLQPKN
ncbi:MAG: HU family DNA-binding protein [Bacteroidaceae bacterium]|nr:HU family DNA-binding protein [Bacteroidaceae bacterium]